MSIQCRRNRAMHVVSTGKPRTYSQRIMKRRFPVQSISNTRFCVSSCINLTCLQVYFPLPLTRFRVCFADILQVFTTEPYTFP